MKQNFVKKTLCLLLVCGFMLSLPFSAFAQQVRVLLGDTDSDGKITAADARFILRLAVGMENKTADTVNVSDINRDGIADSSDARLAMRVSVGLEKQSGAYVLVQAPVQEVDSGERDASIFSLPVPAAPKVSAASDTFTVTVYGNGHGVGLSQWGAVFMAEAGYTYEEILAYFFRGSYVEMDAVCPETVFYNGMEYPTEEIVAQITSMEIGGIALDDDAIKAQAVAIYTLFKLYNYSGTSNNIGVKASSYDRCSDRLKAAVHSVIGQYVTLASDRKRAPVLTVYSALHAGASMNCSYTWGSSYPVSVSTPFEYKLAAQTVVYRFLEDGVQTEVVDGFGNTLYKMNPSGRLVFDNRTSWQSEYFAEVLIYPRAYIQQQILAYDSTIELDPDPAKWFTVLEHNASIDANRGYVKNILVGNTVLSGVGKLSSALKLGLRSDCYTITYNR